MDSTQLLAHLRASLRNAPLWNFALEFYAREEVAAACLQLQDEANTDVCELLWRCWLESHGLTAPGNLDAELVALRRWQVELTRPLRQRRRELKQRALTDPEIAELRDTIKRAELLAEREALRMLQRLTEEALLAPGVIRPLRATDPPLAKRLSSWLPEQKERHLHALQTLERCLDPSQSAR